MSGSSQEQGKLSVTDEQARLKAIEIIESGKTIEEAGLPEDMALAVRRIVKVTFGVETEPAKGTEGNHGAVTAEVYDSADAEPDKLAGLKQTLITQYDRMDIQVSKPSFENVLSKFGKNKLEIADTYDTPYLLMLPVMKDDKITGYKPVIAEGKQEMGPYKGDDLEANLEDRIATRWDNREDCESGMTKIIYEPLFKAAKKAGKPIDRIFRTICDGDYKKVDPFVSFADSHDGRPGFRGSDAGHPSADVWFRSAVVGDVLNI